MANEQITLTRRALRTPRAAGHCRDSFCGAVQHQCNAHPVVCSGQLGRWRRVAGSQ